MQMTTITQRIIKNVECAINAKGLKKRILAEKIGLTPHQFSDLLTGRRTIKAYDVFLLCHALDISPNELFEYKKGA